MTKPANAVSRAAVAVLDAMVALYQGAVSPWLGPRCRFHPTCSHYARRSLRLHGAWRGTLLTLRRLLRCHPFHPGGYDPVPERAEQQSILPEAKTSP